MGAVGARLLAVGGKGGAQAYIFTVKLIRLI